MYNLILLIQLLGFAVLSTFGCYMNSRKVVHVAVLLSGISLLFFGQSVSKNLWGASLLDFVPVFLRTFINYWFHLASNIETVGFTFFASGEWKKFVNWPDLYSLFFGDRFVARSWLVNDVFSISWDFCYDGLSLVMAFVVLSISLCVVLFSSSYMRDDPNLSKFMSYLLLFTFFMLVLIFAGNFFILFIGWEGVGICSYLLIGFWFTRVEAGRCAIKAILVNKIGDFGLVVAIALIYKFFGTLSFKEVFRLVHERAEFLEIVCGSVHVSAISVICFFLLLAAMGKSAQFGLHTWLPDAMEGPTPVSALIHAATMVTAGVYLIIRCSSFFEYAPEILNIMTVVGALTALFGASIAFVQYDLKKIIAYSTCSQLGYMFLACGLSGYSIALFHLVTHAFFKAALFLLAGYIVHLYNDQQDIRMMGGLRDKYVIALGMAPVLSLMGVPPFMGYYSKHEILVLALVHGSYTGVFAYFCGVSAAVLTVMYNVRLIWFLFVGQNVLNTVKNSTRPELAVFLPLIFLSAFSILIPYTKNFFLVNSDSLALLNIYTKESLDVTMSFVEYVPVYWLNMPTFLLIPSLFWSNVIFYIRKRACATQPLRKFMKILHNFLTHKWYFDTLYNEYLVKPFLKNGFFFAQLFDKGFLNLGPTILVFFEKISRRVAINQSGVINDYAAYVLIFLVVITGLCLI